MQRRPRIALLVGLALPLACGGDDGGGVEPTAVTVEFVSPVDNSVLLRDGLDGQGRLVAAGSFELATTGGPVSAVTLTTDDGTELGSSSSQSSEHAIDATFDRDGVVHLVATALDDDNLPVATATLRITVALAQKPCRDWLDLFEVTYENGPTLEGVPDPITAQLPIAGIEYQYYYDSTPRTQLIADCSTIRALAMTGPLLKERGVVKVIDIGVYDYRCIGGGEPPDCPMGVSQHALAKAIDLNSFVLGDGRVIDVETDWIIDGDGEETCSAPTENAVDEFLHDLACELFDRRLWNIVLTPNYNEAHRNHFHVDLTTGAELIIGTRQVDVGPGH